MIYPAIGFALRFRWALSSAAMWSAKKVAAYGCLLIALATRSVRAEDDAHRWLRRAVTTVRSIDLKDGDFVEFEPLRTRLAREVIVS